jgi:hypothetical protein
MELLKLVDRLPLTSGHAVVHTPPDSRDYLPAATVEHGLAANPPASPPVAIEGFN